ncbi:MAG: hypothetical protein WD491_01820, partial [Balneolales bacterium]
MFAPLLIFAEVTPIYTAEWLPDMALIPWVQATAALALAVTVAFLVHFLLRSVVLKLFSMWAKRSKLQLGNTLFNNKVPQRLALLVPLIVLRLGLELVPALPENMEGFLQR